MKHKYLLGLYDDEEPLLKATKSLRQLGYQPHEIFTPFPVHGLDHAMGLQDTRLHTAGFVIGACGALFAVTTMGWISALDWPVIIGGKPFFSLPAYVPIIFELTVLTSAIGMVVIYYLRNGFSVFKPTQVVELRSTDDRFVIAFCNKKYNKPEDIENITKIFKETGAVEVREQELEQELPANLIKAEDNLVHDDHH